MSLPGHTTTLSNAPKARHKRTAAESRKRHLGAGKHHRTLLAINLLLIIGCSLIPLGQTALLTNIYGKKLSKITNISHRFLLLPSSGQHSFQSASMAGSLNEQLPASLTSADSTSFEREETLNNEPQAHPEASVPREQQRQQQQPGSELETEKLPSPLALTAQWKQQQQQSQQQSGGQVRARLTMVNQNSSSNAGPLTLDASSVHLGTNKQSSNGADPISSGLDEMPNPNINNLGHEITKILRKFFLHGYDKRVRPNYSGPPALVNVSFHIIGISSVDEVQMDFTTDFYFRQKWFDPRLVFDPVKQDNQTIDELCVGAEFAEKIWLPDTFFANEKTATFHKATTENTFIRIGHNGRVYRSIRLTVTCSCPMDLQYFPMDRQRCKIEIESYGYNTRDIDYRWEKGEASVTLNTKIELPQFKILGFKMGQELQNLSSGDYIRLYCEIHFVRSMGYYLIQIYIPASLIVMISWVSFWLHRNATPARVALGVTTVLTMTTLMSSTNAALPKISYIKSIDVFLGTCFVMVFASLLEYASVGYIGKRIAMKRKRLQDLQQMQQHHQKVCVAAAASAAAAAVAAQDGQQLASKFVANHLAKSELGIQGHQHGCPATGGSQTLHRRSTAGNTIRNVMAEGSKTLQRTRASSGAQEMMGSSDVGDQYGQRSSIKALLDNNGNNINGSGANYQQGNNNRAPTTPRQLALGNSIDPSKASLCAAIAAATAGNHPHAPTTEFEVSQTHDMIRICGLTPSVIDKHSRVVFPICFVCFNLMYWIIYGHISQQIEDKGPPLIPFIKG